MVSMVEEMVLRLSEVVSVDLDVLHAGHWARWVGLIAVSLGTSPGIALGRC